MARDPLQIVNYSIQPGERISLALPTPELYTCAKMHIPIHVIHGKKEGPCLLVCAAMHGDEMNGIVIIQKLLAQKALKNLAGTLIVIPALNVYGLVNQTRNLPDRRDLDGSFPGHESGSFASRLAYTLHNEILSKANYAIDIHTGEPFYKKLPQIHTNLKNQDANRLAKTFGAPVMLQNSGSHGLLWQNKSDPPIPTLIYQTGEAWRLDDLGIKYGLRGILHVMKELEMIPQSKSPQKKPFSSLIISETKWIRSPGSGLAYVHKKMGQNVSQKDKVMTITDPFGTEQLHDVYAPCDGIITTINQLSLQTEGESVVQIGIPQKEGAELPDLEEYV